MISASQIQEILSLYKKHGWNLRRVLLTKTLRKNLNDELETLFAAAEILDAEIDAVWFSRASGIEQEAWEIRRLSETPYALIEIFDADDDEDVREESLKEMQMQLKR